MAARLLCPGERVTVIYARNFRSFVSSKRAFSSQGHNDPKGNSPPPDVKEVTSGEPLHSWLNIRAGIFGPSDKRLPLPGDVGLSQQMETVQNQQQMLSATSVDSSILSPESNYKKHIKVIYRNKLPETPEEEMLCSSSDSDEPKADEIFECRAQECPQLVKKDFQDLFPRRQLNENPLTVITLSQKTMNDMSSWSESVEVEREELLEYFITAAQMIRTSLEAEGYWADFIDPSSGRPYYGDFTNSTFFETDERYRYLGFCIEDLGCCKVVTHGLWGTYVFVGAIFTNAPLESKAVKGVLYERHTSSDSKVE